MMSYISNLSYILNIKSVPGLKFVDYYQRNLSLLHMFFSPETQLLLQDADSVLFLIGTNSIRCFTSLQIINQVEEIIFFLKNTYFQFNRIGNITICSAMPCLKTCRKFPTENDLMSNIESYNRKLNLLSHELNFKILNLPIHIHHLARDKIHIDLRYQHRIFNCIINHFNNIVERTSRCKTTDNKRLCKYYNRNRK
jgi:hypothetical protein